MIDQDFERDICKKVIGIELIQEFRRNDSSD